MHSNISPKTIKDTSNIRIDYNNSTSVKTVSLDANYIDVKGISYNGSVILAPFTSVVLIKNGPITNPSPIANAGMDQTIQSPVDSINLSGSGTDLNGIITSYNWTKTFRPTNYNISNSTSATTAVTGLVQGVYQFQLTVTDTLELPEKIQ